MAQSLSTQQKKQRVLELLTQPDITVQQIADQVGCHRTTVQSWLPELRLELSQDHINRMADIADRWVRALETATELMVDTLENDTELSSQRRFVIETLTKRYSTIQTEARQDQRWNELKRQIELLNGEY